MNFLLPHSVGLLLQRDALVTGYYFDRNAPIVDANLTPAPVRMTWGGFTKVSTAPTSFVLPQGQFFMVPGWDQNSVRALITLRNQAQSNPEMIADLGLIDAFFEVGAHGTSGFKEMWRRIGNGNGDPFFFPPRPVLDGGAWNLGGVWNTRGVNYGIRDSGGMNPDHSFRENAFRLDRNQSWGALKPRVMNILAAERVLASYPWPPPKATVQYAWFYQDALRAQFWKFLLVDRLIPDQDIRTVITLLLIQNYDAIQSEMTWAIEQKAKQEKIQALIKGIATAIASTVFSLIALPAVISTTINMLFQTVDLADKVTMARGLAMAAKQFEGSAADFAAELNRVAAMAEAEAAAQERVKKTLSVPEAMVAAEQPGAYIVTVDGVEVGKADNPEGAAKLGKDRAKPGQTAEVFFNGKSMGTYTAPVAEPSKTPWWIVVPVGGAAAWAALK